MMRLTVLKLLVVAMLGGSTAQAAAPADPRMPVTAGPGETVFKAACAQCHLGQVPKAPTQVFLGMMEPEAIYAALTTGVMQSQAAALSAQDKQAVAGYLGDANLSSTGPAPAAPSCSGAAANFDLSQPPDVRNWGADLGNSHFVPAAAAGLAVADVPKLKLKWAFAFPGAIRARSQPSFAGGSLFVGSQNGTVYALDAASGCVRWTFKAGAEVRTAIAVSTWKAGDRAAKPQVFFGDLVGARVLAGCTYRSTLVVAEAGGSPQHDPHGCADLLWRTGIFSGVLVGRGHGGSEVPVLYFPRIAGCAGRNDRSGDLENLHHR